MKPFFSIIIPTLNEETHLPPLLDSLLTQTTGGFEVIVSDAKSEDKTVEVARGYIDSFKDHDMSLFVVSKHERNVSLTRNYGATKAKGTYLVFFDADNLASSTYVEELHKFIVENHHPPFLTTAITVSRHGVYGRIVKGYINSIARHGKKVGHPFAPGYNTVMRAEVFEKIGGFDPEVTILEDYEISLRAQKLGYPLSFVPGARIVFSMRRFEKNGLKAFGDYARIIAHSTVKGPPRKKKFHYPMGGDAHK